MTQLFVMAVAVANGRAVAKFSQGNFRRITTSSNYFEVTKISSWRSDLSLGLAKFSQTRRAVDRSGGDMPFRALHLWVGAGMRTNISGMLCHA